MMNSVKKYILTVLLIFCFGGVFSQQTVQFSQYMFNGLAVNPAYAGYKEALTANLNYRMQWTGIEGAPRTGTVSVDGLTNTSGKNMGLGMIVTSDHLGPESISSAYANYAYRIRLDEFDTKRLSFGIAAGAVKYNLDASKFSATNISDAAIPPGDESKLSPDMRGGIYYYSSQFYLGISALNLLSATDFADSYTITKQVRHYYLTAGVLLPLTAYLDWKPSFMYKEDFKGPSNLDLTSSLLINKRIWVGASYRTGINSWSKSNLQRSLKESNALAVILELYCNDHLRLGYSFDFTTSKLANSQSGSHEISISFSVRGKKARILSPRYF